MHAYLLSLVVPSGEYGVVASFRQDNLKRVVPHDFSSVSVETIAMA
jgi:hypothetical protein